MPTLYLAIDARKAREGAKEHEEATNAIDRGATKAADAMNRFKDRTGKAWETLKGIFKAMVAGTTVLVGLAGAFTALNVSTARAIDNLIDTSAALQLTIEKVSLLEFAADRAGTNLGEISSAIRAVSAQVQAAGLGDEKALALFNLLGVDPNGKDPVSVTAAVATSIGKIEDATQRLALSQDLLGRSGFKVIELFKDEGASLRALAADAEKLRGAAVGSGNRTGGRYFFRRGTGRGFAIDTTADRFIVRSSRRNGGRFCAISRGRGKVPDATVSPGVSEQGEHLKRVFGAEKKTETTLGGRSVGRPARRRRDRGRHRPEPGDRESSVPRTARNRTESNGFGAGPMVIVRRCRCRKLPRIARFRAVADRRDTQRPYTPIGLFRRNTAFLGPSDRGDGGKPDGKPVAGSVGTANNRTNQTRLKMVVKRGFIGVMPCARARHASDRF